MVFRFVIRRLGALKSILPLPFIFEGMLQVWTFIFNRPLLRRIDRIERIVSRWHGVRVRMHKYGGLQFDYGSAELGHIHGNGMLDVPLTLKTKREIVGKHGVEDHHVLKNSGWVSLLIKTDNDADYALELLQKIYAVNNRTS